MPDGFAKISEKQNKTKLFRTFAHVIFLAGPPSVLQPNSFFLRKEIVSKIIILFIVFIFHYLDCIIIYHRGGVI
jgi:hypothetical protein